MIKAKKRGFYAYPGGTALSKRMPKNNQPPQKKKKKKVGERGCWLTILLEKEEEGEGCEAGLTGESFVWEGEEE